MIDYSDLLNTLSQHDKLAPLAKVLPSVIEKGLCTKRHGDLPEWLDAYANLPATNSRELSFKNRLQIGTAGCLDATHNEVVRTQLERLIPWRKGPYEVFGTHIDTEWRSDWKWDRLIKHISPLKYRTVLDVGCGNGYHCWRMWEEEAEKVIGIDPSPRFIVQFYMLKKMLDAALFEKRQIDIIPAGIEDIPVNLQAFDTTFSMGVLYHRRSPIDHLRELKNTLKPGGELVLETLVIDGGLGEVLVPEGRYAMMNNVWFLPSCLTLESWLRKCGFLNVRCVDEAVTTTKEQRSTDWMRYNSLSDFLDPSDPSKTAEGHPAPKRAIFVATKPA